MRIINKIVSAFMGLTMTFGVSSCDYLDVVPSERPSVDNTMDSYAHALGFLYSAYVGTTVSILGEWKGVTPNPSWSHPIPGNVFSEFGSSTDEIILDNVQMDQAPYTAAIYTNSVSGAYNYNALKGYHNWISQAMTFMDKLQSIGIHNGIVQPEEAEMWMWEAKFLIAYYHYCLLRRYGPIPIINRQLPTNTPQSQFPGRQHYDYCVNWICSELDECAKHLPARREAPEAGRATSVICKAIKARLLLYAASPLFNGQFPFPEWTNKIETPGYGTELVSHTYDRQKWVRAKEASEEALEMALGEGQRELYYGGSAETQNMIDVSFFPVDGITDEFKRKVLVMRNIVKTKESNGNREHIWAVNDFHDQAAYTWYGQRIPRNILPTTAQQASVGGWFTMGTSWNFSKKFLTINGLQPDNDPDFIAESEWLKSAGYKDDGEKLRSHIINMFKNREPRFYAWQAFDGGDYGTFLVEGKHPCYLDMLNTDKHGTDRTMRDYCPTGIADQKWIDPRSSVSYPGQRNYHSAPIPLVRLAELYLNLGEINAELGNTEEALKNINIIRKRAGAVELTTEMVAKSGKSLLEWARDERSIELFDEMHRYFDLRRWCQGKLLDQGMRTGLNTQVINPTFEEFNQLKDIRSAHIYHWDDRLYLYPFDNKDLYSNPQFVQSPGF